MSVYDEWRRIKGTQLEKDIEEYQRMCTQTYSKIITDHSTGLPDPYNLENSEEVRRRYEESKKWSEENDPIEFDGMGDW